PTVLPKAGNLGVHPNPAYDIAQFDGIIVKSVKIFAMHGGVVYSSDVKNNEINISNLDPGQYIIQITDIEGNVTSEKLMKK
ncbi:T9SS type A sorting domain-containing protein, partial [Flavobacteriaceae bacterium Ap0902]|nr:T9SS type A sorting domain-containing protein [Flavobacteriaceae bacterium Ap0902]